MIAQTPRLIVTSCIVCMIVNLTGPIASPAAAQSPAERARQDNNTYIGFVTADDVYVRSGPADSYYPFGKVHEGELITVVGSKFNWAKVRTEGPAFKEFFGYVRVASAESNRIRLSGDGKELTTLGRTDLLAPNYNTEYNPLDSWKPAAHLGADRKLRVLDTIMKGSETFYKVSLTEDAIGWVNLTYVREATKEEIAAARKKQEQAQQDKQKKQTSAKQADAKPADSQPQQSSPQQVANAKETAQPEPRDSATKKTTGQAQRPQSETRTNEAADSSTSTTDQKAATPQTGEAPDTQTPGGVLGRDTPSVDHSNASKKEQSVDESQAATEQEKDAWRDVELTLETLEQRFKTLQKQPIRDAEVEPLRQLYLRFAGEQEDELRIKRYAEARARQLEIWRELQHRQARLAQVREELKMSAEETEAVREAMERQTPYAGVGRLTASTIYNGKGLPRLLRLSDPATGRTIAYVEPKEDLELMESIGQLVGIVGKKQYDAGLRLTLIEPKRVDTLAPSRPHQPEEPQETQG